MACMCMHRRQITSPPGIPPLALTHSHSSACLGHDMRAHQQSQCLTSIAPAALAADPRCRQSMQPCRCPCAASRASAAWKSADSPCAPRLWSVGTCLACACSMHVPACEDSAILHVACAPPAISKVRQGCSHCTWPAMDLRGWGACRHCCPSWDWPLVRYTPAKRPAAPL